MGIEDNFVEMPPKPKETSDDGIENEEFSDFGEDEENEEDAEIYPTDTDSLDEILYEVYGVERTELDSLEYKKYKKNYLKNIKRPEITLLLEKHPLFFDEVWNSLSGKVFNAKDTAFLVHNIQQREEECSRDRKDWHNRILQNPHATDEEYRLGVYKEGLESQVRDAVFTLLNKGYITMGSGFHDQTTGSQSITIDHYEGLNRQDILHSIIHTSDMETKQLFNRLVKKITVDMIDTPETVEIVIIPKHNMILSLEDWGMIWSRVAQCVPKINNADDRRESKNGLNGIEFREKQDKMKEGKNAWLGFDLAFVNGKVTPMLEWEFEKLELDGSSK